MGKHESAMMEIPINKIKLGRNSRMTVTDAEIAGLMQSIKETGLLQPIGVVPGVRKGDYEIAYGNRRFLAISKLGFKTIPAIVHASSAESDVDLKNLTENIQRKNLSLQEAGRYIELLRAQELTADEIAVRLGVSPGYVRTCLDAYQEVPEEHRKDLEMLVGRAKPSPGKIGMTTAKAIINAQKNYGLTRAQSSTLYKAAKHDEKFTVENVNRYAKAISLGEKNPIAAVDNIKQIRCNLFVTETEFNRAHKKYVENGPFKNVTELVRNIVSGKISYRMKLIESRED